jgi:glycogen synthase
LLFISGRVAALPSSLVRVLMLSWEYPPLLVGGVAVHVQGVASAMARSGHDVVVLTLRDHQQSFSTSSEMEPDSIVDGVRVLRADVHLPWIPDDNLVARVASDNHALMQLIAKLGDWRPDVVHAHDWLVAWAANSIKELWNLPLVATIHATERGRHGGHLPPGLPATINSVEWWLTYQARSIITCSRFMMREVISGFELPAEKVQLIPNGVDVALWTQQPSATDTASDEQLVLAWGRVQYEKGFQVLVQAISTLRTRAPKVRCVIAGRGTYLPELQSHIEIEGVEGLVRLAGFVSDTDLRELVARASVIVIPSLYEPFGIVALEGMAAGVPIVVSRTGGLAEIIEGTDAGLLFEPGNANDLCARLEEVLHSPELADSMRSRASHLLRTEYTWDAIAERTIGVYRQTSAADG